MILVALLLAVLGDGAAGQAAVQRTASIKTYRYEITISGGGQSTSLNPYPPYGVDYTGGFGGTFTVKYQAAITLNSAAQTIAVHSLNTAVDPSPNAITIPTPEVHSVSVAGSGQFNVTAYCAGPPCTGPSNTCSYSVADISPYYVPYDGRLSMPGMTYDADYGHAAYASGTFWINSLMHGIAPNEPPPFKCTNPNFQVSPDDPTAIPGFTQGLPIGDSTPHEFENIPLSNLGKPSFSQTFTATGPCGHQFDSGTCSATDTVSFKLLPNPSDTLHVGYVDVSETQRFQNLINQLRPQIGSLASAKETLERQIAAQTQRATDDSAKVDSLNAQLPAISSALDEDAPFLKQIADSETALPDNVKNELRQEEDAATRLGELQDQLVGARDSGDQASAQHLQKQVASLQKLVDQLLSELHGKLSSLDPTLDKWLTATRAQQQQFSSVQLQLTSAMFDREEAADALIDENQQRTAVDDQLNKLVEQFVAVDYLPDKVTVTDPSGGVVFAADISKRTAASLDQVNRDLETARPADEEIAKQRKAALKDFLDAEALSSKALANVADTIMNVAYKKALVDFAYNAYDVIKAGAKGGLVGAVAETLKKVVEAVAKEAYDSGGGQLLVELRHPGIPWARGANDHFWVGDAKELNARFQIDSKLSGQYFADQARKLALERLFKDSITGPGKDQLNKSVGTLVLKWWKDVPIDTSTSQPLGYVAQFKKEAKWLKDNYKPWLGIFKKHNDKIKELNKGSKLLKALSSGGLKSVAKGLKPVGGDLLASFFKDLSKNIWKGYFDLQEQQAWQTYFEDEAAAQALYLPWQQAGQVYDSVHEYLQVLEQQKADLLAGYDPAHGTKVLVDKKFKTGTKLKVTLKLYRPSGGANTISFEVVLGDRTAGDAGKYAYSVSTTDLTEGQSGLGLAITAR